jgi:hypothetical protein
MTDAKKFLIELEHELLTSRRVEPAMCDHLAHCSPEAMASYGPAFAFLGLPAVTVPSWGATTEADRVNAARLMLLKLWVDTGEPRWSSHILSAMVDAVMATPGGRVADLVTAMYSMFGEFACPLTDSMRHLIKDVCVDCFVRHRKSYMAEDFAPAARRLEVERPNQAQALLCLRAYNLSWLSPKALVNILRGFVGTSDWVQAVSEVEDYLSTPTAKEELARWLGEASNSSERLDVEKIAKLQ